MTIIGGIAGALIGSSLGGPAGARLGWSIGTTVGGVIDALTQPGVTADVGKLSDLRYSGSNYGSAYPRAWGKNQISANIIWVANYVNNKTLVPTGTIDSVHYTYKKTTKSAGGGGSGGGSKSKNVSYTYKASFAAAFMQGTIMYEDGSFVHRFPVFKKIWADDQIIYDADNPDVNIVTIRFYTGTESQTVDTLIEAAEGVGNSSAYRGIVYCVFEGLDITKPQRIPNIRAEIWTNSVSVGDICEDIVGPVGLIGNMIDFSAATTNVDGFVVPSRSTAQDQINSLISLFGIDEIEVDGKLKLIPRGMNSVATISVDDLGAIISGGNFNALVKRTKGVRRELPGRVDVTYNDIDKLYEQSTQTDIKQTADFTNSLSVNTNLSTYATTAKQIAAFTLETAYNEADSFEITLPWKYQWLAPADVIVFPDGNFTHRCRILTMDVEKPGVINLKLTPDNSNALEQSHVVGDSGSGGGGAPNTSEPVPTNFFAWSGPELRLEDQYSPGFYVAGTGPFNWKGGEVYYSPDGTTWVLGGSVVDRVIFGESTNALADGAGNDTWDTTNSFQVDITNDGVSELENTTEDDILTGQNIVVLNNEILGFTTQSLGSPYHYTLSHLRRGMRGTSFTGHLTGDYFVLATTGLERINVPESYTGTTVEVRVVSPGQVISDVTGINVTIQARTLTPIEQDLAAHELVIASSTVLGHIKVGTTLTIDGSGVLDVAGGGSGFNLVVEELDGSPSVSNVNLIKVTNGKLTNNGSGSITLDLSGGGGGSGFSIGDTIGGSPATGGFIYSGGSSDVQNSGPFYDFTTNRDIGWIVNQSGNANGPRFVYQRRGNNSGTNNSVGSGTLLGRLEWLGYSSADTAYNLGFRQDIYSEIAWDASNSLASIRWYFYDRASSTINERLRMFSTGELLLGLTSVTGSSKLQVNGGIKLANNSDSASTAGSGSIRYNSGLQVSDGTTWLKIATKRTLVIPLVVGETPGATGGWTIFVVPRLNASATTWNIKRVLLRSEVANSNTSTIQVEKSTASGAFSGSNILSSSLSITGGSTYEVSTTSFSITTIDGGDKVRANFSALGSGQGPFYVEFELEESM